jgi:uncharacterized membrane protein
MLRSITITILLGMWGILLGLFIPGFVAYSVLFLRRHGRSFKTVLKLCGRLFVLLLIASVLQQLVIYMIGLPEQEVAESKSLIIGSCIGLYGSITALVIGNRRARRKRLAHSH